MKLTDVLGLAGEPLAEIGVLGAKADRAVCYMAHRDHDATQRHNGRWRSQILPHREGGDHDIAARFQLAIGFDDDAGPQSVSMSV